MTIEIYFNTRRLLTSATVNRKFQFLFTAVLLPVDTACAFLKSNCSLMVCCLSSSCWVRFAGFFSGHKLALWHCFARRWAALFLWYDIDSVSGAIDKSGRVLLNILSDQNLFVGNTPLADHTFLFMSFFNHGRPTCHFVENFLVPDSAFSYSFDWSQVAFRAFSFFFSSTTL